MKHLFTLLFILLSCSLVAQVRLEKSFAWNPAPERIVWEGEEFIKYDFKGGVADGKQTILPRWIEQFPVNGNGQLTVEIEAAEYENFLPDARADLSFLADQVDITTAVSRQPEGWVGKISLLPIVKTLAGYQRLTRVSLRISHQPIASARTDFATTSVLSDGEVYQISVSQSGVHKLSRDFLRNELGIDNLDNIDPRSIRLYGQPGGMLPEVATDEAPDDLIEQRILIEGEADGRFDGGDYLVFYAEGPKVWRYNASNNTFNQAPNLYDDKNYFYLKVGGTGNGLRVNPLREAGGAIVNTFDDLYRYEEELENPLHVINTASGSGQIWLGDFFKVSREREYNNLFTVPDLVVGEEAQVTARMALRSGPSSVSGYYFVEVNGDELRSSLGGGVNYNSVLQRPAVRLTNLRQTTILNNGELDLKVTYPTPANSFASEAWLDYLQVVARRQLRMNGDQVAFRDTRSLDQNSLTFQLSNASNNTRIWRVGVNGTEEIGADLNGNVLSANVQTNGQLQSFVAFNPGGNLLQPEAIGKVEPQNLHGIESANMLIVTHPEFLLHAERLAQHRREFSGFEVVLATTDQIYHEFSGGKDDPAAIRNFAHMLWSRSEDFRYLLLVGDGSFDHRNIYGLNNNFIPAYEHQGNFNEVDDFPADDFFGIYGSNASRQPLDPDLNISVGRLPVSSAQQAKAAVDKIINYDTNPATLGDWRTRMVFVGDDEDGSRHTIDVDEVADNVASRKPEMNFDKLYFDLFPQLSLSAGDRYPDVTEGLDRAVFRGSLAITYLGHGGPRGWAQERVLTIPQIRNWRNPNNLPICITATCTFAAYDDAEFVSAGEETFRSERGGAIALLTTTRPVFSNQNKILTRATLNALVERPNGQYRTLGEVIRIAKNTVTSPGSASSLSLPTENARKFTLLGDPATVVALPTNVINTTGINEQQITSERVDTVRALDQITISGEVVDVNGNLLSDFKGLVYPTVFDKPQIIPLLEQDQGSWPFDVEVQRNIVFRGRATVREGKFTFTFVVPSDINYEFGAGKVSYYAADPSTRRDAAGFYDRLIIGGTNPNAVADDQGPQVDVFMNNEEFVFGGQVEPEATLLVKLEDDLGINVTGNSIGHDLEAVLDDDTRNAIVLNDYYEANPDNFRAGEVRFPLFDLEPGRHTVSVRAWDVANNSATGNTEFIVAADSRDALTRVLNYPNPFTDRTCFQFDHTLVGEDVNVLIQIFTVSGRLVKSLEGNLPFSDGSVRLDDCIEWDGRDDFGDPLARGVYLYQVRLQSESNNVDGDFQKLVILK
ncbi:MAG: type IX secretion system sortase PorU [Bacteroidota bacterium]